MPPIKRKTSGTEKELTLAQMVTVQKRKKVIMSRMEPALKQTEEKKTSLIRNFEENREKKNSMIKSNIDRQMLRMQERLKNRRSKSLIKKEKSGNRKKSFDFLMWKRKKRAPQTASQAKGFSYFWLFLFYLFIWRKLNYPHSIIQLPLKQKLVKKKKAISVLIS